MHATVSLTINTIVATVIVLYVSVSQTIDSLPIFALISRKNYAITMHNYMYYY